MADKKITELNSVNLPLTGSEELPIVQNGETKKVIVSDLGGDTKRIVQLNLPQVKILGYGANFSITSPTSSFPTFTFDSGDTDENLLPLNTPKVFVAPFNCVATNLFIRTGIPNNYNYVFYKTDSTQANRVVLFNQIISNGVNDIDNPTATQINKGDLIAIAIKSNNTDSRYADIFLTLEEI